jgi:hypothetical protein
MTHVVDVCRLRVVGRMVDVLLLTLFSGKKSLTHCADLM